MNNMLTSTFPSSNRTCPIKAYGSPTVLAAPHSARFAGPTNKRATRQTVEPGLDEQRGRNLAGAKLPLASVFTTPPQIELFQGVLIHLLEALRRVRAAEVLAPASQDRVELLDDFLQGALQSLRTDRVLDLGSDRHHGLGAREGQRERTSVPAFGFP